MVLCYTEINGKDDRNGDTDFGKDHRQNKNRMDILRSKPDAAGPLFRYLYTENADELQLKKP